MQQERTILKQDGSNYPRLLHRLDELRELYLLDDNDEYLMEDYQINHFLGGSSVKTYEQIVSFCKANHIERVVDIGCAGGHQSEAFRNENIDYLGVSEYINNPWNKESIPYVEGTYPCKLPLQQGDLAISVLCLTWNCYLYEGKDTLQEQCESLKRDFDHCLMYMQSDQIEFVSKHFHTVKEIHSGLYYFSNK